MKKIFVTGIIVVLLLLFTMPVSATLVINGIVTGRDVIWSEVAGNATYDGGVNISGYYYGNGSKLTGISGYTPPANALYFYPITPVKILESLGIGDSPHTTLITGVDAVNNRIKITSNTHKPYNVQNGYSKMEIRSLTHPTTNAWVIYTSYLPIPPFFDTYLYLDTLPIDWAIGDTITNSFAVTPVDTARIELLTLPADAKFAYFLTYVQDTTPANTVYTSLSYPATGFEYIYLKPQAANLELQSNCIVRLTDNRFWLKTLASDTNFRLSIKLLGYYK